MSIVTTYKMEAEEALTRKFSGLEIELATI